MGLPPVSHWQAMLAVLPGQRRLSGALAMPEAFICDAIRTPVGRYNGGLAAMRVDDLAAHPIKALMQRNADVDWGAVDDVVYGCVNQAGEDNRNVAGMAGLLAGQPVGGAGVGGGAPPGWGA